MPRYRERKTTRGPTDDQIKAALALVTSSGISVREAARSLNICHVTLHRYIKKIKNEGSVPVMGYRQHKKVLNEEDEAVFCEYILSSADLYFILTPRDIRSLLYQFAVKKNCRIIPPKWHETKIDSKN